MRLGLRRYFTGISCRHGHIAERYVSTSICVACRVARDVAARKPFTPGAEAKKLREAAIAAGEETYFTGRPCVRGHVAPRSVANTDCLECVATRYARNRERERQNKRNAYWRDPEAARARRKAWITDNPEKSKASKRKEYEKNRAAYISRARKSIESDRKRHSEWAKKWRIRNPDRFSAAIAKRRFVLKGAMPSWVSLSDIEPFYAEAKRLSAETGTPHEVDHIIPLQGKTVSGLHVPWNLQVIPRIVNRQKSNKLVDSSSAGSARKDDTIKALSA